MNRSLTLVCSAIGATAVLLTSALSVSAADPDPRLGTWKLNVAKSTFDPGPAPRSQTRTYTPFEGDGVTFTQETISADGSRTPAVFSAHYDGKDYKWTTSPTFDTIALKRIDAYAYDTVNKKSGKVAQLSRIVVSRDGRTMTNTQTSPPEASRRINNVLVYDKQ